MSKGYNVTDPVSLQDAVMGKLSAKRTRQRVKDKPDKCREADRAALDLAARMDAAADAVLEKPEIPVEGTGGEIVPMEEGGRGVIGAQKSPAMMAIEASIQRASLADEAGIFIEALDAAQSVQAQDAMEKMLAHQLAALHRAGMEMLTRSAKMQDPVESCRLANAASRIMKTYQDGMIALKGYRRGGTQIIKHVHQYTQVQAGGQAIVTGDMGDKGGQSEQ